MKITTVDTLIDEFRNGRDIWSRGSVELAVREIERLRKVISRQQEHIRKLEEYLKRYGYDPVEQAFSLVLKDGTLSHLEELQQAEIEQLKENQRWIPVNERLPEDIDGDRAYIDYVIKYVGAKAIVISGFFINSRFVSEYDEYEYQDDTNWVTHWKYRPEPPESEEE